MLQTPAHHHVEGVIRRALQRRPHALAREDDRVCALVLDRVLEALAAQPPMAGARYAGHMNCAPRWSAVAGGLLGDLFGINMLVPEQSGVVREIEREVIGNLCHLCGLTGGGGRLTAGGSISNLEGLYIPYVARRCVAQGARLARRLGLEPPPPGARVEARLEFIRALRDRALARWGEAGLAQLEACWDAPWRDAPPMAVLAGHNAHYSIRKAARLIGGGALRVERVPIDARFRVDARALASRLESLARERVEVLAVVTTAGTTATGSVDPMAEVAALQRERGFWWHVDAAYGGHFCASLFRADTSSADERDLLGFPRARPSRDPAPDSSLPAHSLRALRAARRATSISIDPHKLGFVAKGCGALLLADPAWMSLLGEEAGYFRDEVPGVLPLGRQHSVASGLEGSRSGRAPISCYVTHRALPLHQGGLGALLERGVELAQRACRAMQALTVNGWRVRPLHEPDTNIVCAVVTRDGQRVEDCSRCAAAFVDALRAVGAPMCSLTVFRREEAPPLFDALLPALGVRVSSSSREVAALRFVFANPELSDAWPRDFTRVAAGALEEMTP